MKIWRRLSALVVVAMLAGVVGVGGGGCGAPTECDEALDKVQQCGVQDAQLQPSGDACEAIAQCQAKCVMAADCKTIEDAASGLPNSMVDCMGRCGS